jgi:hypothetical protein
MTYRTAACDVHDSKFTHPQITSLPDRISRQFGESDQAVLLAVEEQPFSSVSQLFRTTHPSRMTVYRLLTGSLNYRVRHFRSVRHLLSDA